MFISPNRTPKPPAWWRFWLFFGDDPRAPKWKVGARPMLFVAALAAAQVFCFPPSDAPFDPYLLTAADRVTLERAMGDVEYRRLLEGASREQ